MYCVNRHICLTQEKILNRCTSFNKIFINYEAFYSSSILFKFFRHRINSLTAATKIMNIRNSQKRSSTIFSSMHECTEIRDFVLTFSKLLLSIPSTENQSTFYFIFMSSYRLTRKLKRREIFCEFELTAYQKYNKSYFTQSL